MENQDGFFSENHSNQKIKDLVSQNYVFAAVLHYFGIDFYHHQHQTLAQICEKRGIKVSMLVRQLETAALRGQSQKPRDLTQYPIEIVIEYLKHTHRLFMRRQLPYMAKLISDCNLNHLPKAYQLVIEDLKIAFPLFAEDFVRHIFEEEEELFGYVDLLDKAYYGKIPTTKVFYPMQEHSISRFLRQHQQDDDEMRGIRDLTSHYVIEENTPLIIRVLYAELEQFEKDLKVHADVENRILLPKALKLESQLKKLIREKSLLN